LCLFQEAFRILQVFQNRLGDLSGVLFGLGGQNHGHVGGVVTVFGIGRDFDFNARQIHLRQQALAVASLNGTGDQGNQFLLHANVSKPFLKK